MDTLPKRAIFNTVLQSRTEEVETPITDTTLVNQYNQYGSNNISPLIANKNNFIQSNYTSSAFVTSNILNTPQ